MEGMLEFQNITKRYKDKEALKAVNLTLGPGVHGLLGPNGAGKTTLMNILTDLLVPTDGKVLYNGEEIRKLGAGFREALGYLPQELGFYPNFKGRELLRYYAKLKGVNGNRKKIEELLEFVNLKEDANRKVGGYSGGMKRRLGIAIALLNDPEILVLDEPTAGLDPEERMRFRNIIGRIGFHRIVVLSTHIVSDIESVADDVIMLKQGEVLAVRTIPQMLQECRGQVWRAVLDPKEAEAYLDREGMSAMEKTPEGIRLHLVSEQKPHPKAEEIAEPTLEDAYLYYFRRT